MPIDRDDDDERRARLDTMLEHLRVQTEILNRITEEVHEARRRSKADQVPRRRRSGTKR
jgi:hypothetical protein